MTIIARHYAFVPHETSIPAQLGAVAFGNGTVLFAPAADDAGILILAANTSFADFPRLSAIWRAMGTPRVFHARGTGSFCGDHRLAALGRPLVVFDAKTTPHLRAGRVLSFTLSQGGWRGTG
jgi:hypothetical protein